MSLAVKQLQYLLLQAGAELPRYGADGDLGNETRSCIDSLTLPKHVKQAMKEVGTKEYRGEADNPDIVKYHSTSAGKYSDDEVPWCGSFVNWVMLKAGQKITVPYPERAKAWELFGNESDRPTVGSIAVKSRRGGGHVCIVIGRDVHDNLLCLGGNQNDEVNIKSYRQSDFYTFREPLDLPTITLPMYNIYVGNSTSEA